MDEDVVKWPGWAFDPAADRTGMMHESPTGRVFERAEDVPPGWVDGDGNVVNPKRRAAKPADEAPQE